MARLTPAKSPSGAMIGIAWRGGEIDGRYAPRTSRPPGPAQRRRRTQPLLAVAGLATVLLASACDTSEQVPWATYNSGLQVQIDAAAVRGNCAALQALLNATKANSEAHEKATGFPNDALVSYIQATQVRANCTS